MASRKPAPLAFTDPRGSVRGTGLRIHPRQTRVRDAEIELMNFLAGLETKHDLTEAEMLAVVAKELGSFVADVARLAIREERHGDRSKPGGLADG